ncbi:type II toxin-antitoxin system mRNA interferase toxin, RelE/StbE family [Emergencia sp. JLR.KK010]
MAQKCNFTLRIEPDWLLVYKVMQDALELSLIRTGSYSDLF